MHVPPQSAYATTAMGIRHPKPLPNCVTATAAAQEQYHHTIATYPHRRCRRRYRPSKAHLAQSRRRATALPKAQLSHNASSPSRITITSGRIVPKVIPRAAMAAVYQLDSRRLSRVVAADHG